MKRFVPLLLIPVTLFAAIENVRIDTQTHQVQPPTPSVSALYDFQFGTLTTDITGSGGGGSPGGAIGELQYKSGVSAFGGLPALVYNGGTDILSLQTANKFNLIDPVDATKKVQLILSGITTGNTRNFTIPNADFTGVIPTTATSKQFLKNIGADGIQVKVQPTEDDLSISDITSNNVSITKHGLAPKAPNDPTKYLDGTGAYTIPPGGTGTPGGSNQQVQVNSTGTFGGIPSLTYDSAGTLLTLQAGAKFNLVDPSSSNKKATFTLSNISSGTTRNITIPNADSITVVPNSGLLNQFVTQITTGSTTTAQPSFTNLSGSIATSQQNIPVGKTLYLDTTNGNNATALPDRFDKPYATLNGATGLLADASAGDDVNLGPGNFTEAGPIVLPANVSFTGAGAGVTTITVTGGRGIVPATGDKLSSFTVDARTGANTANQFAIGADTADTAFTDVTISGVQVFGNNAGLFFNKSGVDRVSVYDCQINATQNAVVHAVGGNISLINTDLIVVGTTLNPALAIGVAVSGSGPVMNVYGGTSVVTNGVLAARGISSVSSAITNVHGTEISTTATTANDLFTSASGALYNDRAVRTDHVALVTSGTINQIVNTYEGNLGLTDITTSNSNASRHGLLPKLSGASTDVLDGTGVFRAETGGGGGSISDAAYNVTTWNGDTTVGASKNALRDYFFIFDPDGDGKVSVLDIAAGIPKTDASGNVTLATGNVDYASPAVKQDVGDADTTITAGTTVVNLTAALTASRVLTLPAASGYGAYNPLVIIDPKAVESSSFTISVARAGSDTIDGGTGNVIVLGVNEAGGTVALTSDGTSKWTTMARGGGSRLSGHIEGGTATSGNVLRGTGTKFTSAQLGIADIGSLASNVATFLTTPSSANLRSAMTDETGTGMLVFATSPTLVTPLLGTPTSVTLTNATGLPPTTGIVGWPANASGALTNDGSGVLSWAAGGGSGTVTNTGGALTSNSVVLGAGTNDTKVIAGITTNGTSTLNLGVAGASIGTLNFRNGTSGNIFVVPPTGALGSNTVTLPNASSTLPVMPVQLTYTGPTAARTITLPDANFTAARTDAAQTFTGVQTFVAPILGTPTSATLTNATGLPVAGITSSTSTALGVGSIELGAASDTTLARNAAGVLQVEGIVIPTISSTNTMTNKNNVPRTNSVASATSWTPDFDTYDMEIQTALAGAITVNAPTFTGATQGSQRMLRIKDNGTARAITWNGTYKPIGVTLPATTVISKLLYVGMKYNSTSSQWDVLAVGQE